MPSLTRAEARDRAALLQVRGYALEIDLTRGAEVFGSTARITFGCARDATTFVQLDPAQLHRVELNGTRIDTADFDAAAGRLRVRARAGDNALVVETTMRFSHDGEGMHRHVDPADGRAYLYAMSFLDAAPRWFACFDQPDLKAPVSVQVRCPDDWVVAGNGPATQDAPGCWRIAPTAALATYFTTLVAGSYHQVRSEHDGVQLSLLVRRSLSGELDRDAADLFTHTARCLDELHRLFDLRYPWGEYAQAFVPDLTDSAMENPGCVTLGDGYIFRSRATDAQRLDRAIVMAHEMAHMWFGDLVTMRWWDDLWLNESFAEYLGNRVTGEHSWVDFGIARKSWGYAADRRPSTHPVAGNGAADAAAALTDFDGISYAKGASVLRQLAAHVGDEVFLRGLRSYIRTHAYGNAEFADLVAAWAAAGAENLPAWAHAWLRTTGLDDLIFDGDALMRRSPQGTPRRHAVQVGCYAADGTELALQPLDVRDASTPVAAAPGAALVLADARDETWARLVLRPAEWAAMPGLLGGIADARARVAVWNALQLAVTDGELDPRRALDIVIAVAPREADDSVLAHVGEWAARTVCELYLPDAERDAALAALAGALGPVLHEPARQLAAARLVAGASPDTALLRDWLAGRRLPDGLHLDADLRWSVLQRLAQLGALSVTELDAEVVDDRSSMGLVHAARCRAARPDADAKAAAWAVLMHDAECPVQQLYATAQGFWQPGQRQLTDGYVEAYTGDIAATARLRTGWVVERVAALAFPRTAVEPATLAAADRVLAKGDLDHGIRRAVLDARDDLLRAVRIRDRYSPTASG